MGPRWQTINFKTLIISIVVVVQWLSGVWLFATPWTAARQPSFTISQSLLKLMSIESVMQRADSLEKTLMLGKTEGKRRRG